MYPLFETISIQHCVLQQISYHNERVNRSRKLLFHATNIWDLSEMIRIPGLEFEKIYRCKFLFNKGSCSYEFHPYVLRNIRKLYLKDCGNLDYSLKYTDRSALDHLKNGVPDPDVSDILLVKKGYITDTSFSNIVFFNGNRWYTPSTPLLRGTKRQLLIDNKQITERDITIADLSQYTKARLINAMLDLENGSDIMVENIINDIQG